MIYFEHHLRNLQLPRGPRVSLLRLPESEDWVFRDLAAEFLDLYPDADVRTVLPSELGSFDLLVIPLLERPEFAIQDVLYRRLDDLARLTAHLETSGHVMVYRARWREVEVVASRDWSRYLRRKRVERALVGALGRHRLLRWLLPSAY
jgi:hypothetical protein